MRKSDGPFVIRLASNCRADDMYLRSSQNEVLGLFARRGPMVQFPSMAAAFAEIDRRRPFHRGWYPAVVPLAYVEER